MDGWRILILICPLCMVCVTLACLNPQAHKSGHIVPWENSPCPKSAFSSVNEYGQRICIKCSEINQPQLEVIDQPCNSTHDAVIVCIRGYYRLTFGHERDCRPCTQCANPSRSCGLYMDTVCCPNGHYHVEMIGQTPTCVLYCGLGEYLDESTDRPICRPCHSETYMNQEKHRNRACMSCRWSQEPDLQIDQPCNRTHPPLYVCRKGMYISQGGTQNTPPLCSLCQICLYNKTHIYLGQPCSSHHDTVCCQQPDMEVVPTLEGFHCQQKHTPVQISHPAPTTTTTKSTPTVTVTASSGADHHGHRDTAWIVPAVLIGSFLFVWALSCSSCCKKKCGQHLDDYNTTN